VALGSVMVTRRSVIAPLLAFRKLESNPLTVELVSWAGTHGAAKVDWVTVWLPWVKLKKTMSPCWATTASGKKTAPGFSVVLPPTVTTMVSAHAEAIRAETWTINYQNTGTRRLSGNVRETRGNAWVR